MSVTSRHTAGKIMLLRTPIDKENMPSKSGQNGMDSKLHKLEIVKFVCVDCIFGSMVIHSFTGQSCFLFTIHFLKIGQIENPLGSPVVRTSYLHYQGPRFDLWSGN